jgi:lipopolysaccharide export system permease protein
MRTFTRQILVELTAVFLAALVAFTAVVLLFVVVREMVRLGLPPTAVLHLVPYILPDSLKISVPVTLLLATTTVYSRMSGSNEVVAIKALGISPMAILWPSFFVACLLSWLTVWLNDVAVPWGRCGAQRVIVDAVEEIAYGMLRTERYYSSSSPQFSINVKRVDDRKLIQPTVTVGALGRLPSLTIDAQEAELRADREENVLKIWLRNANVEFGGGGVLFFPQFEYEIPLLSPSREESSASPSAIPMGRLARETARHQQAIQHRHEDLAAAAGFQMMSGDFDDLLEPSWQARMAELAGMHTYLCRLKTEPHRRWSAGFSCLCFVWVGAPMAIWLRKRDFLQNFFVCFLVILIAYYPALMGTIILAKDGVVPPVSVWAANLILLPWGYWALRRVLRY